MFRLGAEAGLREVHSVPAVEIPLLPEQRRAIVRWRNEGGPIRKAARKIPREPDLHEITLH